MELYIRSMKRVLDLTVSVVHGGHFDSFGQERLREIAHGFLVEHDR
jgi:glyoxylase-like metal-dependent hydrolase (beta-lactamase superfamily II)